MTEQVHACFSGNKVDVAGLARLFDGLDDNARAAAARTLAAREQALLYEAAAGFRPLTLADFVPADVAPLAEVIHSGRNSLPMFTRFEKRFCRPEAGGDRLWGYNEQSMKWLTGPGYFVCYEIGDGEVLIDYYEVPPGKPAAWPPIRPNSARLSRLVYYHTRDTMRGVSRHVSIGRAAREGKPMDNWFVLCRRE